MRTCRVVSYPGLPTHGCNTRSRLNKTRGLVNDQECTYADLKLHRPSLLDSLPASAAQARQLSLLTGEAVRGVASPQRCI